MRKDEDLGSRCILSGQFRGRSGTYLGEGGLVVRTTKQQKKMVRGLAILWVAVWVFSGCSVFQKKEELGAQTGGEQTQEEAPLYYDFGDVPIPPELKLNTKLSFIYRTSGFSAGVLVFKGAVELGSLIDFFENNMARDNWRTVSTFKSPRTLLLFQKQSRWCVINITDDRYSTHVEIWVAPTLNLDDSGLLK